MAEGTIKTWLWDYGDGVTESKSSGAPFQHTYTSKGTYTVTLAVTGTSGGCSARKVDSIKISPFPVVNFGLPAVCLTDSYAKFTDSTTIADNSQLKYLWHFGDQNANAARPDTSNLQNPTHQYTAVGPYTVTLTVTPATGCSSTVSKNFTVNGSNPHAGFTLDNNVICSNKELVVTNTSSVTPGNITELTIYFGDGTSVIDHNTYPGKTYHHLYTAFQSPVSKTVSVYLTASSGGVCNATATPQALCYWQLPH